MVIVAIESHQGGIDMQVTTIGLDIAKNVFQPGAPCRYLLSGTQVVESVANTSLSVI